MTKLFDVAKAFRERIEGSISDASANLLTTIDPTATPTADAPTDATAAGLAILNAISGGFTLQTFTASDASWSVPPELANAVEAYVIAVGGGGKGMPGQFSTAGQATRAGGVGGTSGGYSAEQIDPSTLGATLNVTIGAAATTNGANGGTTSIVDGATTLVHSVVGVGSVSTTQGYVPSNSLPGAGGSGGGTGSSNVPAVGQSNAYAAGGTAGTNGSGGTGTGGAGGAGGAGQTADTPLAGGGGGGGGGGYDGTTGATATGGTGGAGGFPGSGSGGGGGASQPTGTANAGPAGTPGNGFAAILWR